MASRTGMGKAEKKGAMMTTGDVAQLFDMHPGTIRRWCEQGKIRAYREGPRGNRRFRREDVAIAYLERSIQQLLKHL